jgi:hypothetical protein
MNARRFIRESVSDGASPRVNAFITILRRQRRSTKANGRCHVRFGSDWDFDYRAEGGQRWLLPWLTKS